LIPEAALRVPPELTFTEILPASLPAAWREGASSAGNVHAALTLKLDFPMPWQLTKRLIDGAARARAIEILPEDLSNWPCDVLKAPSIRLRLPAKKGDVKPPSSPRPPTPPTKPEHRSFCAESILQPHEIQNLAEHMAAIKSATIGLDAMVTVRLDIKDVPEKEIKKIDGINEILKKVKEDFQLS